MSRIIYTYTDEAPALATESLQPVLDAFAGAAGVEVETWDISLAGRILAAFNDHLEEHQRVRDALTELGELAKRPEANIIKLPNISASVPQLKAAITELQAAGYAVPDYPEDAADDAEVAVQTRYDAVKGSAVNPVLREGNSDRRAPAAVKAYARAHPHRMGAWSSDSPAHVSTMSGGDFRSSERSATLPAPTEVAIEHHGTGGEVAVLKAGLPLEAGEIIDAAVMSKAALTAFLAEQVADARASGVLFSVHLKATMMKVSDPIIFGHAVRAYYAEVFAAHGDTLAALGVSANDGMSSIEGALDQLDEDTQQRIRADITAAYADGPALAQVDSRRGITNLHVPSDVIIDASMPVVVRDSGTMWNADDEQQPAKCVIPDSSYAALYGETLTFCRDNGAFDPRTMGSVPNVGLMARKAEEYGSHDKTFEMSAPGTVRVVAADGTVLLEHEVAEGDIWRMCQTKDDAVRDWIHLAVNRARASDTPAIFWLDDTRAHDTELLVKVREELDRLDTDGLELEFLPVAEATRSTLERIARGEDVISVTGNVLRDYLTDLFPILEVGTSAKMLSIVPLMAGGGLFETGAGGSAPKHVQQLVAENHLRWDSLGEFLALTASFEHLAERFDNDRALLLGRTLDTAVGRVLEEGRSPSRVVPELDNRGSHYYLTRYWAEALAAQTEDPEAAEIFAALAAELTEAEDTIVAELAAVQGEPADIGGYYWPDRRKAAEVMRPSPTFNAALDRLVAATAAAG